MRIGLISDTHIAEAGVKDLWPEIFTAFDGVDLILHAGDIMQGRVLDDLERVAPVYAALGNHDRALRDDPRVKPYHLLELEGQRVALVHEFLWMDGPGAFDQSRSGTALRELFAQFIEGNHADVVVFGDSHYECVEHFGGALLVNPGSPTFPRNMSPRLGHVGFLTIERGSAPVAEIRHLEEFRTGAD